MTMRKTVMWAALLLGTALPLPASAQAAQPAKPASCNPVGDLHFVCGLHAPEDFVRIPGTQWILTSGMAPKGDGGLFLVDAADKRVHKITFGDQIAAKLDSKAYPGCKTPPDNAQFISHGLSLRMQSARAGTLYVVAHGARETIEVFGVDTASGTPALTWRGCVPMPGQAANSVASMADGTLYASVIARAGISMMEAFKGVKTGDMYVWKPGDKAFQKIPGLSLAGDNGVEVSADGATLFVAATGDQALYAYDRAHPGKPLRVAHFDTFTPDNIHWSSDGRLIVAGQNVKATACPPGAPANPAACNKAPAIALVDPTTMKVEMLYDGKANPAFGGVSTGLVIGNTLWISSLSDDRIAYLELKSR